MCFGDKWVRGQRHRPKGKDQNGPKPAKNGKTDKERLLDAAEAIDAILEDAEDRLDRHLEPPDAARSVRG
jgi:hypothetical protein